MTVKQMCETAGFEMLSPAPETETDITVPFCCDLLSWAMGRAPEGCAWVTVIANLNTIAVAELTDAACVIFAEGVTPDEKIVMRAIEQGVCLISSTEPEFETALKVYKAINA